MRVMLLLAMLFLLFAIPVQADGASIDIEERGSVLNYYDMYYVVDVEGNITITNENDFKANTVEVRLNPETLNLDTTDGTSYIDHDKIRIPYLEEGESRTISYSIQGITTRNVIEHHEEEGHSVLSHLMEERAVRLRSDLWINLRKSDIMESGDNRIRHIDVGFTNPTPLRYDIDKIQIIRTEDKDINDPDKLWVLDEPEEIRGGESWERSIADRSESMRQDSIYWFSVDHDLARVDTDFSEDSDIDIFNEDDIDEVPEVDRDPVEIDEGEREIFDRTTVFLRKRMEPSTVYPGDVVNISLIATNLDSTAKTITIEDSMPEGFEPYRLEESEHLIDEENMVWEFEVNRDTSRIIEYSIKFVDDESIGLDHLPEAEASFDTGTARSQRVPFIKRYIPDKSLYVQKSIERLSGDMIGVNIRLRNMGEASLSDLVVKDYLEDEMPFLESSQDYEDHGIWEVPELRPNEEWEVSYRTDTHRYMARLPQVMGIDESKVLKTMIMDSVIYQPFFLRSVNTMEVIGLSVFILLPLVFIKVYKKKVLGH